MGSEEPLFEDLYGYIHEDNSFPTVHPTHSLSYLQQKLKLEVEVKLIMIILNYPQAAYLPLLLSY